MSEAAGKIQATLQALAADPAATGAFLLRRDRTAGEPAAWHETLLFRSDQVQACTRLRSFVDDPGAAIGDWRTPPEPARVAAMARAALQSAGWGGKASRDLVPGGDIITWTLATPDGQLVFAATAGDPSAKTMAPVDAELRRMAVDMQRGGAGGSLRLSLAEAAGRLRVALHNDGRTPAVIRNPFTSAPEERSWFRLESAPLAEEVPGVTAIEPTFAPAPVALTPERPELWGEALVTLPPGGELGLAGPAPASRAGLVIRASLSDFRPAFEVPGAAALLGRAFSNHLLPA